MKSAIVILTVFATLGMAQQAPVAVQDEPHHKTILQNEYLRVYRITLQPGQSTLMHTHSHDDVAVRLANSKITVDVPGKPTSTPSDEVQGTVTARAMTGHPMTHRVNCVGDKTFDVLDVEILKQPSGTETKAASDLAAENPSARVYRWQLAGGESTPEHTHERPYLIIATSDMNLKMDAPDGSSMTHTVKAGDVHWVSSRVVHTLTNAGTEPGVLIEIELK